MKLTYKKGFFPWYAYDWMLLFRSFFLFFFKKNVFFLLLSNHGPFFPLLLSSPPYTGARWTLMFMQVTLSLCEFHWNFFIYLFVLLKIRHITPHANLFSNSMSYRDQHTFQNTLLSHFYHVVFSLLKRVFDLCVM